MTELEPRPATDGAGVRDHGFEDRAAGALCGLAAGDALGAPWEFSRPEPDEVVAPIGGGPFDLAPGEWTDDTAQAVAVAEVAANGRLEPVEVGRRILEWYAQGPRDVGASTAVVLRASGGDPARLRAEADGYFRVYPQGAAGNGSLMRTSPVALAHLGDREAIAGAARAVSRITHGDPLAADGCVLWCLAIDLAVREQRLELRDGLASVPAERRGRWGDAIDEAEQRPPESFRDGNGFVVTALQAAWSAIVATPASPADPARQLADGLERAVRIGGDTDTVAAIAGQLLGARWGASAIPREWRELVHGWPGLRFDDLEQLAVTIARRATGRAGDA